MKIQDLAFFMVLIFLLWREKRAPLVTLGLACLALAIPLFWQHIFFTAERLTWYAAAFLLSFTIFSLRGSDRVQ